MPFSIEFWQLAFNNGGVFALSLIIVFQQFRENRRLLEEEKDRANLEREDKLRIAAALEQNTKALTELVVLIRSINGK